MVKNKKAWIKLIEAFVAISLIIVILSLSLYSTSKKNENNQNQVQDKELEILNTIQYNETLREEIINVSSVPVESNESGFPEDLNNFWNKTMTSSIACFLKICTSNSECTSVNYPDKKEIFVQSVIISSTLEKYSPLQLKAFCWTR